MGQNMGLPGGANDWARDVGKALETLAQLQEMARRICSDFGLDIANPARGLYTGASPSVDNPVQLKLPSLQDLDIRDAQDGDLLTFDGKRGKWVARAHDTVQLPKEFPLGDPASYYVPGAGFIPADTWSFRRSYTNLITDPRFEHGTGNWAWSDDRNNVPTSAVPSIVSGGRGGSGNCMRVDFTNNVTIIPESYVTISSYGHSLEASTYRIWVMSPTAVGVEIFFDYVYDGYRVTPGDGPRMLEPGVWTLFMVSGFGGDDPFYGPQLDTALVFGVTGIPSNTSATLFVDDLLVADDTMHYMLGSWHGDTPDDPDYSYSWNGAPDASTSTALQNRRIQIPSAAAIGDVVQIIGEGFVPGEPVDLYLGGDVLDTIAAEPDGTFDARMTIPADAWVSTNNSISALGGSGVYPWATINITAE